MAHPLSGTNPKSHPPRRQRYLPGRYRRKKGHTNFDLSQQREANRRDPVTAKPFTDLAIPDGDASVVIDWCEPLDPAFRVK